MQVLTPLYGADNVQVSVNTVVNLDRTYTDSTDYNLEDWAEGNDGRHHRYRDSGRTASSGGWKRPPAAQWVPRPTPI